MIVHGVRNMNKTTLIKKYHYGSREPFVNEYCKNCINAFVYNYFGRTIIKCDLFCCKVKAYHVCDTYIKRG